MNLSCLPNIATNSVIMLVEFLLWNLHRMAGDFQTVREDTRPRLSKNLFVGPGTADPVESLLPGSSRSKRCPIYRVLLR